MRRAMLVALALWLTLAVGSAAAQDSAPEETAGSAVAQRAETEAPADTRASSWKGPRVELAYRIRGLKDSMGGRSASTAVFSGFLPTRRFRGGGGVEAGGRSYELGATEGLVSGHLFAGYQHLGDLGRFVPYIVAIGEWGVLFGKRFHTPQSRSIRGAGVELGTDVNLVRSLYVGLGVGFMLYTMDGLAYDSFGMRVSIGL